MPNQFPPQSICRVNALWKIEVNQVKKSETQTEEERGKERERQKERGREKVGEKEDKKRV